MHWYCCNNAVHLLNKAKSRVFQSIMNFENLENRMDFICLPASQPATQTYVRPGCAMCTTPEIQHSKCNRVAFTKLLFRRRFTHCARVILLSFLSLLSSLSIGMRKQFQPDHNIPYKV